MNAGPIINSGEWDNSPVLLSDDLTLIFSSARLGGFSTMSDWNLDLWLARRETKDSPWGQAVNLGSSVNTNYSEMSFLMSADGRMLYFTYHSVPGARPGGNANDIWQVPIIPLIDLNGDGIVNSIDMCIVVEHWGEDYSLCDIGPTPFGDDIVDIEDLKVLAEHLFEQINDPTLIAHWPFDDTEGMFAADSVDNNNAIVMSGATWQPNGGQVDGALELNGVDGCVIAGSLLNPSEGPFSVFA